MPVRAQVATGIAGASVPSSAGVREEVGDDVGLAGVVRQPGRVPVVVRAGEEVEQRARRARPRARRRDVRSRRRRDGPAASSAARIASARSGSSTAGVRHAEPDLRARRVPRGAPRSTRPGSRPSSVGEPTAVGSPRDRPARTPRPPPARARPPDRRVRGRAGGRDHRRPRRHASATSPSGATSRGSRVARTGVTAIAARRPVEGRSPRRCRPARRCSTARAS